MYASLPLREWNSPDGLTSSQNITPQMSQWTRESVSVNQLAVNNLCDSVDVAIKGATELITGTEELDYPTIKMFAEQV